MRSVAVVVQPGFAPFEFGSRARPSVSIAATTASRTSTSASSRPDPGVVPANIGFSLNVEHGLDAARDVDILVLAPIPRAQWDRVDERVVEWSVPRTRRGAWLLSVCSGAFVIAAAGVLDGKRATTHWRYADTMARMYPRIDVDPDVLYVQSDNIITSAGTAAGLDACLHLLRQELGSELANRIARRMVVAPQRDGVRRSSSPRRSRSTPRSPSPRSPSGCCRTWVPSCRSIVSPLAPTCRRAPSRVASRPISARRPRRGWRASVCCTRSACSRRPTSVSTASPRSADFGSAAVLRQNFARTMGLTPTAYRARFSCAADAASGSVPAVAEAIPA